MSLVLAAPTKTARPLRPVTVSVSVPRLSGTGMALVSTRKSSATTATPVPRTRAGAVEIASSDPTDSATVVPSAARAMPATRRITPRVTYRPRFTPSR